MKTMIANTGKIEKIMIILLIFSFVSLNLYSQFSFDKNELISFNNEIVSVSNDDITNVFRHLTMAEQYFVEESIDMEDWMLEPSGWLLNSNNEISIFNEVFNETDLNFENWMFDTQWLSSDLNIEDELKYEPWMFSPLKWQ